MSHESHSNIDRRGVARVVRGWVHWVFSSDMLLVGDVVLYVVCCVCYPMCYVLCAKSYVLCVMGYVLCASTYRWGHLYQDILRHQRRSPPNEAWTPT